MRILFKIIAVSIVIMLSASSSYADDWGNIDYEGQPWTKNVSEPYEFSRGLQGRHLSVWASHGRYYDLKKAAWQWQRPSLFLTREDLLTQTIVVPYLIPMLENAGAVVFTPRERDWQRNEVIVDNDGDLGIHYIENSVSEEWGQTDSCGFAFHTGAYVDGENPFHAGTVRKVRTSSKKKSSTAVYMPLIPAKGKYAVYVSYQTVEGSIDNALYTVYHKGVKTEFHVNQTMGGGTWVYLGTFDFDEGCNGENCVSLSNYSKEKGFVTTDAVRFGGGMGNITRGGSVSGYARSFEGARYYAQWAGMNYDVYSSKNGADDYGDDINARSLMTNYLAGGSVYVPNTKGAKVPIELTLAIHSDAGYLNDSLGIYGSLGICTTTKEGRVTYNNGLSRTMGSDLAHRLLDDANRDLTAKFGSWATRGVRDRNYSESRVPEVPCAIFETLSHQSFPDMKLMHDPNFKFTLARSIYKTILRFVADAHHEKAVVAPLAPTHFSVDVDKRGNAELNWKDTKDELEKSATADSYVLYIKVGNKDWDNGQYVKGKSFYLTLHPDVQYDFRVVAVNEGGKSFPSETISAYYCSKSKKKMLIVNGFHRLSAPASFNDKCSQGFDITKDPGVWQGINPAWCGRQLSFNKANIGSESYSGLGYIANNLAGTYLAGNDFNYVSTHTAAVASCNRITVCSASSDVIEDNRLQLDDYVLIDLILGNEKDDGHSLVKYKTFSANMQRALKVYTKLGGSLLVSGSYVASDMMQPAETAFVNSILKLSYLGTEAYGGSGALHGMGTQFEIYNSLNEEHYAASQPDYVSPIAPAFTVMQYDDSLHDACVAYQGKDYRCLTMTFPFECIKDAAKRNALMAGMLNFLIKK